MTAKAPVTVITGFLGSGKTTLVNHILTNTRGLKFAVVENEFGDVGVDDGLIGQGLLGSEQEEVVEMMNGCICCTVRSDLVKVLKRLLIDEKRRFDGIVIETTGLADPAPVAQTFFVDETLTEVCYLDAIVTVVDARHIVQHLDDVKPDGVENESVEQVAFADRILLNKIDLVTETDLQTVTERLRKLSAAEIIPCQRSQVDITRILRIQGFSLERILELEPDFLADESAEHLHDTTVSSLSIQLTNQPLNIGHLQYWLRHLLRTAGNDLFRYKGIIDVQGMEEKFVFQGIHMLFSGTFLGRWEPNEVRGSRFVFIGRNLDKEALRKGFEACIAQPLRFAVGTRVEACIDIGAVFASGVIVAHWDEGNPYRIRLDNGDEVWGPVDEDEVVRAATA